jgi:hypothetical protein
MASKELIEKVARELCLSYGQDPDVYASLCDICGPNNEPLPQWQIYTEQAETATSTILAALQEPTGEMLKDGQSFYTGTTAFQGKHWRSMLNASALGEQSE